MTSLDAIKDLTMLNLEELGYLIRLALEVPEGDVIACGICHGGDVIGFYKAFIGTGRKRNIVAIDSFRGHSAPGPKDSREGKRGSPIAGTHNVGGIAHFWGNLEKFNVPREAIETYEIWVTEETIAAIPHRPVALLWVDLNMYQPTLDCLRYFGPDVVKGGAIAVDDYEFGVAYGVKPAIKESGFGPWEFPNVPKDGPYKLAVWRHS